MTNFENERIVNYLVVLNKPGRRFTSESDTRWGGLVEPAHAENKGKSDAGLRVVLFASWDTGFIVLETLKAYENQFSEKLNLVGIVTDDPLNPEAKISARKRIWHLIDLPGKVMHETLLIESGLSHGVPVYLGEVKTESFHRLLEQWDPDAIIVTVFGQVIDSFTINYPRYGIYNLHPSDLRLRQGAGPAPYDDLVLRKASTSVWSVHQVTEIIDDGKVIGQSPPVCVLDSHGKLPVDPMALYHKMAEALSPLAFMLVEELAKKPGSGTTGKIEFIDFEGQMPEKIKEQLMWPVRGESWFDVLSMLESILYQPWKDKPIGKIGADG